ncbi:membrane protein [Rhodococcus coprophilus]|uniref:Membrane protein n=2 Tax=Rhodococcus coprophilus TaxID=38310 RepID=A0A2X4WYQ7_9NOCA|nr:membrane protein [Rhodococcus coprophilus]
MDRPRGHSGLRHSLGELMTCPFCFDVWAITES